jgi:hypothetical protein
MTEHETQSQILVNCSGDAVRLWRNNTGVGWAGASTKVTSGNLRAVAAGLKPGDVVIRNGRPLRAGLCVGSSDLIGYRVVEHGGVPVAQFVALEVKSQRGLPSVEQERFLAHVGAAGGCAGIVRSVADANAVLRSPV